MVCRARACATRACIAQPQPADPAVFLPQRLRWLGTLSTSRASPAPTSAACAAGRRPTARAVRLMHNARAAFVATGGFLLACLLSGPGLDVFRLKQHPCSSHPPIPPPPSSHSPCLTSAASTPPCSRLPDRRGSEVLSGVAQRRAAPALPGARAN